MLAKLDNEVPSGQQKILKASVLMEFWSLVNEYLTENVMSCGKFVTAAVE